jgi:hypothetical protein
MDGGAGPAAGQFHTGYQGRPGSGTVRPGAAVTLNGVVIGNSERIDTAIGGPLHQHQRIQRAI